MPTASLLIARKDTGAGTTAPCILPYAPVMRVYAPGQDGLGNETMSYAPEAQAGCTPSVRCHRGARRRGLAGRTTQPGTTTPRLARGGPAAARICDASPGHRRSRETPAS